MIAADETDPGDRRDREHWSRGGGSTERGRLSGPRDEPDAGEGMSSAPGRGGARRPVGAGDPRPLPPRCRRGVSRLAVAARTGRGGGGADRVARTIGGP